MVEEDVVAVRGKGRVESHVESSICSSGKGRANVDEGPLHSRATKGSTQKLHMVHLIGGDLLSNFLHMQQQKIISERGLRLLVAISQIRQNNR